MDWTEFLAAPFDAVEVEVQQIWQDVLGRSPIGVFEDLIDLGGDSLLAARIAAQMSEAWTRRRRVVQHTGFKEAPEW